MDINIDMEKIKKIKKEAIEKKELEREGEFLIKEEDLRRKLMKVSKNLQQILETEVEKTGSKCIIVDDLDMYHYEKSLVLKEFYKALRDNGIEAYREDYGLGENHKFRIYCTIS